MKNTKKKTRNGEQTICIYRHYNINQKIKYSYMVWVKSFYTTFYWKENQSRLTKNLFCSVVWSKYIFRNYYCRRLNGAAYILEIKTLYYYIRGLPFIFQDFATLALQSANWQLYLKAWHFWGYIYSERFDILALFVLFTVT